MKLWEVVKLIQEGHKITAKGWKEDTYIKINKHERFGDSIVDEEGREFDINELDFYDDFILYKEIKKFRWRTDDPPILEKIIIQFKIDSIFNVIGHVTDHNTFVVSYGLKEFEKSYIVKWSF